MTSRAAMRLSGACPDCGAKLVRRERRADKSPFISCSAYPECRFAEGWDPQVAKLAEDVEKLRAALAAARRLADNSRSAPRGPVDLARELREIIMFAHPDKWTAGGRSVSDLATGITSRLNALRGRLMP